MAIIERTSSWGESGETWSPWKCRFVMFMQGPSTHNSVDFVDIWLTYSTRMLPPGSARMTGGILWPSKENAPFPLVGSFTASRTKGPCTSGSGGRVTLSSECPDCCAWRLGWAERQSRTAKRIAACDVLGRVVHIRNNLIRDSTLRRLLSH